MLVPSDIISSAFIRSSLINALTGLWCYLMHEHGLLEASISLFIFDSHIMVVVGNNISTVFSEMDNRMLDWYTQEYHLSPVLGFQLPFPSSSVLDALFDKVGFDLRHLVYGLKLPMSSFFLEVLCFYKVHHVKLYPNSMSKVLTLEVFCVAHKIPLDAALFHYFYCLNS